MADRTTIAGAKNGLEKIARSVLLEFVVGLILNQQSEICNR